jgi:hypothetical protein
LFSPGGVNIYLVSASLLGMFEETMGMLPFASRADMYEAMAKVDDDARNPSIAKFNSLIVELRDEHDKPGVREQLKNLWIRRIREASEDEEEPSQPSVKASACGAILGRAPTPPVSPRDDGTAAVDGGGKS